MRTRVNWLDEGLLLLADGGAPALRIEALSRRMGATKGSFYHHFVDLADFRRALLGHYEEACTTRLIAANSALAPAGPAERLRALAEAVATEEAWREGLEVALRAWAAQDDDARDALQRVDALRLDYLDELAIAATGDEAAGRDLARTAYYLMIGSQHAVPPGSPAELRRLWLRLLGPLDPPEPLAEEPGRAAAR